MSESETALRRALASSLQMRGAHIAPDDVFGAFRQQERGKIPEGFSHSAFQTLGHMQISLEDQRDYCTLGNYVQTRKWPDDDWPKNPTPAGDDWDRAVRSYQSLIEEFTKLAMKADLTSPVPSAEKKDHTLLRGILLMSDHNAYHLGQIVSLGKIIGVKFRRV